MKPIQSKAAQKDGVDHVLVGAASRSDAKPTGTAIRFETYAEELDHWKFIKRGLESKLTGYSKAAMAGVQGKIRRQYADNTNLSRRRWFEVKEKMEDERQKLVADKNHADNEILRLKPLIKSENVRYAKGEQDFLQLLYDEMRAIRLILESHLKGE